MVCMYVINYYNYYYVYLLTTLIAIVIIIDYVAVTATNQKVVTAAKYVSFLSSSLGLLKINRLTAYPVLKARPVWKLPVRLTVTVQ